jgi:hypothetical protein
MAGTSRCVVPGCANEVGASLVGAACLSCWNFVTSGRGSDSRVVRNAAKVLHKRLLEELSSAHSGAQSLSNSIRRAVDLLMREQ